MADKESKAGPGRRTRRRASKKRLTSFFPRLPPEVRYMIWDNALDEDVRGRFVVFDVGARRIIPTANLVSPLLRATSESRMRALRYYSISLPLHKVVPWSFRVSRPVLDGPSTAVEPTVELDRGGSCLYLSPDMESIVLGMTYFDFKVPEKFTQKRPYYRYTTKAFEREDFVLSPLHIFHFRNIWSRDSYSRMFQEIISNLLRTASSPGGVYFKKEDSRIITLKIRRSLLTPVLPEQLVECLSKWDVESLKKLVLKKGPRICRRALGIRGVDTAVTSQQVED